jgi:hypothetical protein
VLASTAASYLETLNPEQRRAVEHGVTADSHVGSPLLVIAGAGPARRIRLRTVLPTSSSAVLILAGSC